MNYKGEIQYVRFYTAGSAAQKLETRVEKKSPPKKMPRPTPAPVVKTPVVIEPYAIIGTVVAVVMVALVILGFFHLNRISRHRAAMEKYIESVTAENQTLQMQYEQGYDLEKVRDTAEAMGLVPVDQVKHIKVAIVEPVKEREPSFWEAVWEDIQELFA